MAGADEISEMRFPNLGFGGFCCSNQGYQIRATGETTPSNLDFQFMAYVTPKGYHVYKKALLK